MGDILRERDGVVSLFLCCSLTVAVTVTVSSSVFVSVHASKLQRELSSLHYRISQSGLQTTSIGILCSMYKNAESWVSSELVNWTFRVNPGETAF